jgi:hypothetical protein
VLNLATAGDLILDLTHTYPVESTPSTPVVNYQITITAGDSAGATVARQLAAAISNAPPTDILLTPTPPQVLPNESVTLNGQFTDPGTGDTHAVSINWGDGTAAQNLNLGAGVLQFSANHTFTTMGVKTVAVTITDDDLGAGNATTNVRVGPPSAAARFVDITPGAGPSIILRLQGTPGGTYRVEKADTFGSWSELGVRTVDASGLFEISDTAPIASSRFYRAVVLQ